MATQVKLANTEARLSPSIGIYMYKSGTEKRIGAVKSMSRTVNRGAVRRLELDAAIPGRTVEIIPGALTTLDITIKRAMLYSGDMMEAFGFPSVTDLMEQNIPIDIREYRYARPTYAADGTPTFGESQVVTYTGCYFTSNPQSIDVDGDWQIIQEATLMCSTAITSGGPTNA